MRQWVTLYMNVNLSSARPSQGSPGIQAVLHQLFNRLEQAPFRIHSIHGVIRDDVLQAIGIVTTIHFCKVSLYYDCLVPTSLKEWDEVSASSIGAHTQPQIPYIR